MKSNSQFRVRHPRRGIEGPFTERQLLRLIRESRLTGDEEVDIDFSAEWKRLSSIPQFYDALVHRLFPKEYQDSNEASKSNKVESSDMGAEASGKGSRGQGRTSLGDGGSQGQLDASGTRKESTEAPDHRTSKQDKATGHKKGFGKTVHELIDESAIEDLLKDSPGDPRGAESMLSWNRRPLEADSALPQLESPREADDVREDLGSVQDPFWRPPAPEKPVNRKRFGFYIGILALLGVLYWAGTETPSLQQSKENGSPVVATSMTKEERVGSLIAEADLTAANDSPLFYQAAYDVLLEARAMDEGNPLILSRLSEYGARTWEISKDKASLKKSIVNTIQIGRRTDPHQAQFYRAEAILALAEKRSDEARKAIAAALQADPYSADNLVVASEIQYASSSLELSRNLAEEAVKRGPKNVRAQYLAALLAFLQRDFVRAGAAGVEALRLNPLHAPTYLVLGRSNLEQNQVQDAMGLLETAGRLARLTNRWVSSQAYWHLGQSYEFTGRFTEARNCYLLSYFYSDSPSEDLKAKLNGADLRPEHLKTIASEAEYQAVYFQTQADGLLGQGKVNEAVLFLQAGALMSPGEATPWLRLGEAIEKTASSYDEFRRVMNLYQRAMARDSGEPMTYIRLGMLETEQYNFEAGMRLLKKSAELAPDAVEPYIALGKHYYKRQDYNESLNQFLKAAKISPTDSEVLYYAGLLRLLYKKEGIKDAMKFFKQAYTANPQNYDAMIEWLKLKVLNFEKNYAIKFIRGLQESDPKNPKLLWALGEVYAANKENRRAVTFYHQSLDLDNRSSKTRMSLARSLEAVGEIDSAVAEYRLASLLDRRNSEGFFRAAELLYQSKRYGDSEEVLKFLAGVTPNYPGVHRQLSKVYQVRKLKAEAIASMQKEVSNNPENYKFTLELAELYMEYEQYKDAVVELSKVTNLPPLSKAPEYVYEKVRGYLLLSRCYRAMGRAESAEVAIKLALEIDQNDPELHRELGYVYYAEQRDKEGVKAFEFYLNRNPAARDADTIKGLIDKMRIEE